MLTPTGIIKLMDFGIAKAATDNTLTRRGDVIGSPPYMSPEQVEGKELDARSDLYSLGITMYQMATGQRPFSGTQYQMMHGHLNLQPAPPRELNPSLSPVLNEIILRALAKQSAQRYQTAQAFSQALGDYYLAPPAPAILTPKAGQTKVNPKDGLTYVWIPPATFIMGCSPGDTECLPDERPAHPVTITRGFWIGQTPVTVGAFRRYCRETGAPMPWRQDDVEDSLPIVHVAWDKAAAYCKWAGVRLPTEEQWELAALGGTASARYGNLDDIAWYRGNSGGRVQRVAKKQANAFGLYDMLGNVFEWTADWCDEKYYESSVSVDPTGPPGGQFRIMRGGSWDYFSWSARASYRSRSDPEVRNDVIGLRCAGE